MRTPASLKGLIKLPWKMGTVMRVAVVHDWLYTIGGAEQVLREILNCYPNADVFTLFDLLEVEERRRLGFEKSYTSFLQKMPMLAKHHRAYLPLMPIAIEQFDLARGGRDLHQFAVRGAAGEEDLRSRRQGDLPAGHAVRPRWGAAGRQPFPRGITACALQAYRADRARLQLHARSQPRGRGRRPRSRAAEEARRAQCQLASSPTSICAS